MAAEVLTTAERAKDLLGLVATPSALVTGTFLAFAGKALKENPARHDRVRMAFAILAGVCALAVSASLVALLGPLAWRMAFTEQGGVQAVYVVYWTIFLSVVGTFCYGVLVVWRCIQEFMKPT